MARADRTPRLAGVLVVAALAACGWYLASGVLGASAESGGGQAGVWAAVDVSVRESADAGVEEAVDSGGAQRSPGSVSSRVDPDWAARASLQTGVPVRALTAYAGAQLVLAAEQPGCGVGWNTLAGIGRIETGHGSHGGAVLQGSGEAVPRILGPALDGNGFAAIPDSDGGAWDADAVWDRAVGPMQFIPDTWSRWGADGSGDGVADPNNIDDAALAAARYLCASGSMRDAAGWRAAVFSYNHLESYVDAVAAAATEYAAAGR